MYQDAWLAFAMPSTDGCVANHDGWTVANHDDSYADGWLRTVMVRMRMVVTMMVRIRMVAIMMVADGCEP